MNIRFHLVVGIIAMASTAAAQNIRVASSFVISINGNVAVGAISGIKFIKTAQAGQDSVISIGYVPGDLFYDNIDDKKKLESDTSKRLILQFYYSSFRGKHQTIKTYRIPLYKAWFQFSFIVLRIFDSKGQKTPSYTYMFDFPGYSMYDKGNTQ